MPWGAQCRPPRPGGAPPARLLNLDYTLSGDNITNCIQLVMDYIDWEYEINGNTRDSSRRRGRDWKSFAPEDSSMVERLWRDWRCGRTGQRNQFFVHLADRTDLYSIDFSRMTQRNKSSGRIRAIRRNVRERRIHRTKPYCVSGQRLGGQRRKIESSREGLRNHYCSVFVPSTNPVISLARTPLIGVVSQTQPAIWGPLVQQQPQAPPPPYSASQSCGLDAQSSTTYGNRLSDNPPSSPICPKPVFKPDDQGQSAQSPQTQPNAHTPAGEENQTKQSPADTKCLEDMLVAYKRVQEIALENPALYKSLNIKFPSANDE